MNVTISVDFGQGYRVALTPVDARALYDQLKPMFEKPSVSVTTTASLWNELNMVTTADFKPGPFLTGLNPEPNVDKMAAELEAKVRAEMDKQSLGATDVA